MMLPVRGITHNPLVTYNLSVLLAYPLCGLTMFALAFHLSGDRRAAFLAGVIFAFCPYRERHIEHLNLLSAEGIPLIILGFELARARGGPWRWGGFGAALVVCTALSLYYAAFTVLALFVYTLVLLFIRRRPVAPGAWRGSWTFCLALLIQAALVYPYMRTQQAMGGQRRLQDLVYFSADVRDFLHTGPQSVLYGWSDALWRIPPLDVRQYLFPGWTALALALPGACWTARRARTSMRTPAAGTGRLYLVVAGALALLALGPYLRLFGLFTHVPLPTMVIYLCVPGFQGLRDVGRYDQIAMAFLSGTAAIGAARLFAMVGPRRARRLLLVLAALLALEYWTVQRPLYPVASGNAIPQSIGGWRHSRPAWSRRCRCVDCRGAMRGGKHLYVLCHLPLASARQWRRRLFPARLGRRNGRDGHLPGAARAGVPAPARCTLCDRPSGLSPHHRGVLPPDICPRPARLRENGRTERARRGNIVRPTPARTGRQP